MSLKEKIIKKQLKSLGYDLNKPQATTFRVIDNLITSSVNNYIKKQDMIEFLEKHLIALKKQ